MQALFILFTLGMLTTPAQLKVRVPKMKRDIEADGDAKFVQ